MVCSDYPGIAAEANSRLMQPENVSPLHPVLVLKQDIECFLEAIEAEPDSKISQVGQQFIDQVTLYYRQCEIDHAISTFENCWNLPTNASIR